MSIIPRSIGALGHTLQLPTDERYLLTRPELLDRLAVIMGGRAAEEIACADISTGAHDDLARATELARQMVTRFGMSEKLGAQTFGRSLGSRFLDPRMAHEDRNYSEETARAIDAEVHQLLEDQLGRARALLRDRRDMLEVIAQRLLAEETLDRDALMEIVGDVRPYPVATGERPPVRASEA